MTSREPIGLVNKGTTGYINSVLQALFALPSLEKYILSGVWKKDVNEQNPLGQGGKVIAAFSQLFMQYDQTEEKSLTPDSFLSVIYKCFEQFRSANIADAQEFLTTLIDALHEDTNKVLKKPYVDTLVYKDELVDEFFEFFKVRTALRDKSFFSDTFWGSTKSERKCLVQDCGKSYISFDPAMPFSLPIPSSKKQVSLLDCINLFAKSDVFDGDNKIHCDRKCGKMTEQTRNTAMFSASDVMIICLKRIGFMGYIDTFVDYPLDDFETKDFLFQGEHNTRSSKYRLMATVDYLPFPGEVYISKVRRQNKWFRVSDDNIRELAPDQVSDRNAYLLFYQRQDM